MNQSAHIYHPKDNSLEARVAAYKDVYKAWLNAEASFKFLDDDEWADTLGDRSEVEQALSISVHSLEIASDSFTRQEISMAKEEGLIDEQEALELIQSKLQNEMRSVREQQSQSNSTSHSQKR